MKLAVFFVSISSLRCLWTLRRRSYSLHSPPPTPPHHSLPGSSPAPHSWQPLEGMYGSKDGKGRLTRRKEETERRETLEVNDQCKKPQDLQSGTADGVFASVSSQRERTLTYTFNRSRRQELFYITFLSSRLIFPLLLLFFFFLNQGRGSKESKNQQLRTLTVHSTISTASLFLYTWQTLQPKTTLISFWLFCFWLLLTCHV